MDSGGGARSASGLRRSTEPASRRGHVPDHRRLRCDWTGDRALPGVGCAGEADPGGPGRPARRASSGRSTCRLHGRDDEVSRKIRAVQALEESGGRVFAARADVASEAQMREVVTEARRRFGRIDGVFHAAGVAGGGVMQLRKPDDVTAVMRPKVAGTRVLARVLADERAGLHVAVLVAQRRQRRGRSGGLLRGQRLSGCLRPFPDVPAAARSPISVNWDTWREAGMAADATLPASPRRRQGSRRWRRA